MKEVWTIRYEWTDSGWYAYQVLGCNIVDDSMKVWWQVDMDSFTKDQEKELVSALQKAYPGHVVERV